MVDTKEATESKYINVDLVKESTSKVLVIVDGGQYEETQYGRRLTLKVNFEGKDKAWSPNKDAVKNMNEFFGSTDSDEWVGKKVALGILAVQGKDTVIVKEIEHVKENDKVRGE